MRTRLAAALLIAVAAAASLNSLHDGLILDDRDVVMGNPNFASPRKWLAVFLPSKRPARAATYRPVRELTFALDQAVWGDSALGRHVSALALYLLVALAFLATARRLGLGRRAALVAAFLFALHAAHSETLCWVKNRGELLATLFGLMCIWFCESRRIRLAWLAVPCVLAAAASMESGICFAVVALMGAAFTAKPTRRGKLTIALVLLLAAAAYVLLQVYVLGQTEGRPNAPTLGLVFHPGLALELAGRYCAMVLVPHNLCMDAAVGSGPTLPALSAALAIAALIALTLRRGARAYAGALLLAPMLLASILLVRDRPVAEHRAFAASAGFALCFGFLVQHASRTRSRAVWCLALCAVCALGSLFVARHFVWRQDVTVWRDNVLKSPALPKARLNFSHCCARQRLFSRAVRNLENGLARYPAARRQANLAQPAEAMRSLLRRVRAAQTAAQRP